MILSINFIPFAAAKISVKAEIYLIFLEASEHTHSHIYGQVILTNHVTFHIHHLSHQLQAD